MVDARSSRGLGNLGGCWAPSLGSCDGDGYILNGFLVLQRRDSHALFHKSLFYGSSSCLLLRRSRVFPFFELIGSCATDKNVYIGEFSD